MSKSLEDVVQGSHKTQLRDQGRIHNVMEKHSTLIKLTFVQSTESQFEQELFLALVVRLILNLCTMLRILFHSQLLEVEMKKDF